MMTHQEEYAELENGFCGLSLSNGAGIIAFGMTSNDMLGGEEQFSLLTKAGTNIGTGGDLNGFFFPTTSGFLSVTSSSSAGLFDPTIVAFDSSGTVLSSQTHLQTTPALFIARGNRLLAVGGFVATLPQTIEELDDTATPLWGPNALPLQAAVYGAGIDDLGRVLVLQDGSSLGSAVAAQWLDENGAAITSSFAVPGVSAPQQSVFVLNSQFFDTLPLVGGGLAIRTSSQWMAVIPSGSTAVQPAPAWLAAHGGDALQRLPDSRPGYAVLPKRATVAPCAQQVALISPAGNFCGAEELPIDANTCTTRDVTLGLDGTLLQMLPGDREQNPLPGRDDVHTCTLRYWPAALH
jgi:hypothetical protein